MRSQLFLLNRAIQNFEMLKNVLKLKSGGIAASTPQECSSAA